MTESREIEILSSSWPTLRPHFLREALFLIPPHLDIKTVCKAIAEDQKNQVEKWLKDHSLRKPTPEEDHEWSTAPVAHFRFGIVQPFVVIQKLAQTEH